MRKHLLIVAVLGLVIGLFGLFNTLWATHETFVYLTASDNNTCKPGNYINPKRLGLSTNDKMRVEFVNQSSTPLEIRGFTGGNFILGGNQSATRNFVAQNDITYTAWSTAKDCKIASASVAVSDKSNFRQLWPLAAIGLSIVFGIVAFIRTKQKTTPTYSSQVNRN